MNPLLLMLFSAHFVVHAAPDGHEAGAGTEAGVTTAVQVSGPRFGLAGTHVEVDVSDPDSATRRHFRVVTVGDRARRVTVLGRGRLHGGGVTRATVELPLAAKDRVITLYVQVGGRRTTGTAPVLHVLALDPSGDFDRDLIPSGDEVGLWWTDPTVPNLGCGRHAPVGAGETPSSRTLAGLYSEDRQAP